MYLRALQGYEKTRGEEHMSPLTMVNNLGVLYKEQGKTAEAEAMYLQVLQGYTSPVGAKNVNSQFKRLIRAYRCYCVARFCVANSSIAVIAIYRSWEPYCITGAMKWR